MKLTFPGVNLIGPLSGWYHVVWGGFKWLWKTVNKSEPVCNSLSEKELQHLSLDNITDYSPHHSGFNLWQTVVDLTGELYHHVVCCHRISLLLVSMESFSITSKCCFRGLFTLPKNISWGNTEMLLCTYCIGQSPKMGNGNGFWHHCGVSGMIIILASSTFGSMSESFSLFSPSPSFFVYMCICVSATRNGNSGFLSDKCLLSLLLSSTLLLSSVFSSFSARVFASLSSRFLPLVVWARAVYNGGYSTWQQVRGTLLKHTHTQLCPRDEIPNQLYHRIRS